MNIRRNSIESVEPALQLKDHMRAAKPKSREGKYAANCVTALVRLLPGRLRRRINKTRRLKRLEIDSAIPLVWVTSTPSFRFANLGDALSAVIVSTMSGRQLVHLDFDDEYERLAAVGTIGQNLRRGKVHIWGTGFDSRRNAVDRSVERYIAPADTIFRVHATRGKFSAATLASVGIETSGIYGDPVWFLPKMIPREPPQCELGVVVHLSELEALRPDSSVKAQLVRYGIPSEYRSSIRIINTLTAPDIASMQAKVVEITSCKRILSTSLHGLIIAEAYGIPCAWFGFSSDGGTRIRIDGGDSDRVLDHRVRDFYSGTKSTHVLAYCQDRSTPTDWGTIFAFLDGHWESLRYDASPLFHAFPLPSVVRASDKLWRMDESVLRNTRF